jgi:predicted deacylase
MTDAIDFFSPDYGAARERFRAAAQAAGAALHSLGLDANGPGGEALTIDIAWLGDTPARRIVLHTSGLHGVEAFAGSAIQLALLKQPPAPKAECALVLVHVLNPYGMAWLRRTNENNVDLNRNFLRRGERGSAAPEL